MKVTVMFAVIAAVVTLSAGVVHAHPPVSIELSYDPVEKMVTAVIVHPVKDAVAHHIGKVDVALNGEEILEHEISRQDDDTQQVVMYRIPDAKSGDTLSVEGYCNINGKRAEEIRIP